MDKKLLEKFTWGFEIEGLFHNDLVSKLRKLEDKKSYIKLEIKDDGSVDIDLPDSLDKTEWGIEENDKEVAIGIFKDFKEMLKVLKMFKNEDNYLENSSCGLHIHLGVKDELLRAKIGDYSFIKKLEKWVKENLCGRTQKRLNNTYCQHYGNFVNTYREWRKESKYRFLSNHPQGTFEFRFFAPCKHKIKNVKKFFEFFFNELSNRLCFKSKIFTMPVIENELNIPYFIDKDKMIIRDKIKIEKNKLNLKICV